MAVIISEDEFRSKLISELSKQEYDRFKSVTGPGRSGSIASVYASHYLRIPFIPFGCGCVEKLSPLLIIDTASLSGKTLKRCSNKYQYIEHKTIALYSEPPRLRFWYEDLTFPQRERYENIC